ncbi:hypothetical protein AKJ09_07823 [Labilithrix luteola]|uniref:Uncharacterized protein n=1 Tax=Labilithrix luteola TaxID=1391654 RepID=A0A0K1Q6Y0_9BACT|nr:GNAT family N-acetyltransferase [Labilithrix luteola]AKV01160.1 hypothetical protein AKJ09_07823 [Labilithrix luteola]
MSERTNAASATEALELRAMHRDPRDLDLFRACFARNNPRARTAESLTWQYYDNTTDRLFVDLAVADQGERIAAIYASLPGFVRVNGEKRLALQSLDTLTDSDFRGKGLFVTLAKKTFARATDDGAALIYGFPNGNSAHGFFKKLGWTSLDPVPFLVRPLRASYVADRLKLGSTAKHFVPDFPFVLGGHRRRAGVVELVSADERITRLWTRFSSNIGVALDRSATYFDWRLFRKPEENYRVLALEEGGELVALCAFATKNKHGGRIGYVMELMHDRSPSGWRGASHLLGLAVRAMADDGVDSILAWSFPHSSNFLVYARHAFVPLPERLRPIELHFGARAFDPSVRSVVEERTNWYLSYLDSDTV